MRPRNSITGARRRERSNASARGIKTVRPTYKAATTTTAVTIRRSSAVSVDPAFLFIGHTQGVVGQAFQCVLSKKAILMSQAFEMQSTSIAMLSEQLIPNLSHQAAIWTDR